jgi:ABC-type Zn uptake system ZnuABC Zn-binding protein ZnuA
MPIKYMRYLLVCIFMLHLAALHAEGRLHIVCTTTHLSAITMAVGGDEVTVSTLISYGMCPGHFELTPGQVADLAGAEVVLAHGYEHFLKNLVQKTEIKIDQINIVGNAILPAVHIRIAEKVTDILINHRPQKGERFSQRLESYKRKIDVAETDIKTMMSAIKNIPVLCAEMNQTFLEWLGATIVAIFPRDEDLSLQNMSTILNQAKRKNAQLVVDNLQSSGKAGKTFAEELHIPLAVISNFPKENDY